MTRTACLLPVSTLPGTAFAGQPAVPAHPSTTVTTVVASVNGVAITSDRLAAELARLIPQESFHRNVSADRMDVLRRQALDTVIDDELAYQEGMRRKLRPSSADVKAAWTTTAARYGGEAAFEAALHEAGVTRSSVEHEILRRLIVEKTYHVSVMEHCSVGRPEAEQYFRTHPDRFVEPEQVHVHAVTVGVDPSSGAAQWAAAKSRAEEARRALDRGTPFADVARTYSTDASRDRGGDMGFMHRGSLSSPFESIVEQLSIGAPSEVVQSLYGYHVVLVSEVRPAHGKPFDEVASSLIGDLSATRCAERREAWLSNLRASAIIQMEPGQ